MCLPGLLLCPCLKYMPPSRFPSEPQNLPQDLAALEQEPDAEEHCQGLQALWVPHHASWPP